MTTYAKFALSLVSFSTIDMLILHVYGFAAATMINPDPARWLPAPGVITWVIALALVALLLRRSESEWLPLSLIAAGALSNLVGFTVFGGVVDYIPIFWWYTNTADGLVLVGGLLFLMRKVPISWKRS